MIPKQLQNPEFRFILIRPKEKMPMEIAWSLTDVEYEQQQDGSWKHKETGQLYIIKKTGHIYKGELHSYQYNNTKLINHIKNGGNYGVLCGPGGLAVLDDDTETNELINIFNRYYGDTFTVRSHKYAIIPDLKKKIIFHSKALDKKGNPIHLGELQSWGTQVVGSGSIHPSGEIYDIKSDKDIVHITKDQIDLHYLFLISPEKQEVKRDFKREKWEGDNINDIPISSIISVGSLQHMGGSVYQGKHPGHGSRNGMNFRVDTSKNVWKCFRDFPSHGGGGPAELIAVMEGIIDCSQAGPRCFTHEQAVKVIDVARQKYGLKNPADNLEPKGWANSVSIIKLSDKYNLKTCPKCKQSFNFNDRLGWFKCGCQKGGLTKFAELIAEGTE